MKSFLSVRPAPSEAGPGKEIRLYQSETAELIEGPEPLQARVTLFVITGLFVSMLLISLFMKMDRVVSSISGQIVTVEPTIVLGALDQSIIKTIEVREGERVAAGQVLATLDPTFTTADVGALRAQIAGLDAQIGRARAELAQQPFTMAPSPTPGATPYVAMQRDLYQQRKAQFESQLRAYDEQINQFKATVAKYQNDEARFGERSRISKQIEEMRATLAAAQVGSRLNLLAATDQKLEIMRNLELNRNAVIENKHQLDATIANRAAFIQQWLAQTSQELVTAQGQRDAAVEQLSKAAKRQDQIRIEAPVDGMVLKLAKLSVRSVLNQGDPLIHLAPLKSPLEAEARIAAREIGFIRPGDAVTVKLEAFSFIEHGSAEGKVRSISEGAFTTDDNGQPVTEPYYRARITLTNVALKNVPASYRLVPGMTLTADIHIGSRSLFMYLMRGVVRGFDEAMREP